MDKTNKNVLLYKYMYTYTLKKISTNGKRNFVSSQTIANDLKRKENLKKTFFFLFFQKISEISSYRYTHFPSKRENIFLNFL